MDEPKLSSYRPKTQAMLMARHLGREVGSYPRSGSLIKSRLILIGLFYFMKGVIKTKNIDRIFQSPDEIVTGKSVVMERDGFKSNEMLPNPWPYSMSDYLQGFVGRTVQVRHSPSIGKHSVLQGTLAVAGSNFIGVQPKFTEDLFLIELSSIKGINIMNATHRASSMDTRYNRGL